MEVERKAGSLKSDLDVGESGEEWARKLEAIWKTYLDKAVRGSSCAPVPRQVLIMRATAHDTQHLPAPRQDVCPAISWSHVDLVGRTCALSFLCLPVFLTCSSRDLSLDIWRHSLIRVPVISSRLTGSLLHFVTLDRCVQSFSILCALRSDARWQGRRTVSSASPHEPVGSAVRRRRRRALFAICHSIAQLQSLVLCLGRSGVCSILS
jgi:hypothetical protein